MASSVTLPPFSLTGSAQGLTQRFKCGDGSAACEVPANVGRRVTVDEILVGEEGNALLE